jgi:hypothetical protein
LKTPEISVTRNPRRVFISHAHEDAAFTGRLEESGVFLALLTPAALEPDLKPPWSVAGQSSDREKTPEVSTTPAPKQRVIARCACCYGIVPDLRDHNVGFRVVERLAPAP